MVEKPRETKKKKTKSSNRKNRKSFSKSSDKATDNLFLNCNKRINVLHPLLTKDSRHVVCASEAIVYTFQAKTGLINGRFEEHKFPVCNIYVNEKDPSQIISCSSHEIIFWDYVDRTVMQTFEWKQEATGVYIDSLNDSEHVYLNKLKDERKNGRKEGNVICKYNLKEGKIIKTLGSIAPTKNPLAFHRSGNYIAYITLTKLHIDACETNTTEIFDPFQTKKKTKAELVSVAFHPTSYTIATGTKDGRIFVLYNWRKKDAVAVKLHWHHTPVNDILFTNDGNYLLSGGLETVLVTWHLESQEKSFLPRLGGGIEHIFQSSDGTTIGVSLSTNMIKLISALDGSHIKSIKFLTEAEHVTAGFSYHSKTDCIVLNGSPEGHIQFYQPLQDSVKITLDIIGENTLEYAPGKRLNPTKVTRIAFSDDGIWMATIDRQETELLGVDRKLKFWKFTEGKDFVLNSVVNPPHIEDVNSLEFRPMTAGKNSEYIVASTSNRGEIKLWYLTQKEGDSPESWQLVHYNTSFCGKFREHNLPKSAQFSPDGSLLAVLFDKITLWDPETLSHETTLTWNPPLDKDWWIKSFCFVHNENSRYLISSSEEYLVVWNLQTCFIEWQMQARVLKLTPDPYSKYFAAFIQFGGEKKFKDRVHLYLFDPSSPKPVSAQPHVRMTHPQIKDAIFTRPNINTENTNIWGEIGRLFYMTKKRGKLDICTVKIEDDETSEQQDKSAVEDTSEEENASAFRDIFSSGVRTGRKRVEYPAELPLGEPCAVAVRRMMPTPSHVLPSVRTIYQAFHHSWLVDVGKLRKGKLEATQEDPDNDIDVDDMEVENDESDVDDDVRRSQPVDAVTIATNNVLGKDAENISSFKIRAPKPDFLLEGTNFLS